MVLFLIVIVLVFIVAFFQGKSYKATLDQKEQQRQILGIRDIKTIEGSYPLLKVPGNKKPVEPIEVGFGEFKPKTGSHDDFFANKLRMYFPKEVNTNMRLLKKYPDIALINKEAQFYLDIEIDEVYELEYKFVIHHEGSDDFRNEYFTNKGWYVLRFSEDQIVKYPLECCKFVSRVYAYYTLDKKPLQKLQEVGDIKFVKQWNYEEGKSMAKSDYRENELGVVRKPSIKFNTSTKISEDNNVDDLPF